MLFNSSLSGETPGDTLSEDASAPSARYLPTTPRVWISMGNHIIPLYIWKRVYTILKISHVNNNLCLLTKRYMLGSKCSSSWEKRISLQRSGSQVIT